MQIRRFRERNRDFHVHPAQRVSYHFRPDDVAAEGNVADWQNIVKSDRVEAFTIEELPPSKEADANAGV
jgi:hypothetical protein